LRLRERFSSGSIGPSAARQAERARPLHSEVPVLTTALAVAAASWAVLMALGPILQIRAIVRRRSSHGVSIWYFAILLVGFLLWVAYGVASGTVALVVPNSVAIIAALATIVVALRYR
jgi:MtN3 and saliva related transmembrane protein